ncbi:MAG: hypothetical protein GX421_05115 [Caldisericales bacterium]|nr:hypothetical protein [Caldisericales bacterium]
MKRLIAIVLVLFVILPQMACNNYEDKTKNNMLTEITSSNIPRPMIYKKINNIAGSEWISNPFKSKKEGLTKYWEYTIGREGSYTNFLIKSLPGGWLIDSNYILYGLLLKGMILPLDGKFMEYADLPIGPTDGALVFGSQYFQGTNPIQCWDLKSREIVWSNLSCPPDLYNWSYLKGNKLISVYSTDKCYIYILEQANGEVLWGLESSAEYQATQSILNNSTLFVVLSAKNLDNKNTLVSINIETKTIKTLSCNSITDIINLGKRIFILEGGNSLIELDYEKMNEIHKYQVPETVKLSPIAGKILLKNNQESRFYLFNPDTGMEKDLSSINAITINSSLVIEDQKQLRGVDPDTLETLWWIDKKGLGENAHVAWLDWRGVCVVSDTKIMCFGQK